MDKLNHVIAAQLIGALTATFLFRWLLPKDVQDAENLIMPHETNGL